MSTTDKTLEKRQKTTASVISLEVCKVIEENAKEILQAARDRFKKSGLEYSEDELREALWETLKKI